MSIDIKFRAWDKKYNEMLDDDFILFNGMIYREPRDFEDGRNTNALEIMQFTGLLDKKGVEIYEGDIVHCKWFDDEDLTELGSIEFRSGGFGLYFIPKHSTIPQFYYTNRFESFEVIGNIYENPELLEVK